MFVIDTATALCFPRPFATFTDAANCAVKHVTKLKEDAQIRYSTTGVLVADFSPQIDGTVAIVGICEGRDMVLEWVG